MEKFNIIVMTESGERVYPQGVDWDKWKKRLKKGLDWIKIGLDIVVIIIGFGGGAGFSIKTITITPTLDQNRNSL
jgi:hypothetical protein